MLPLNAEPHMSVGRAAMAAIEQVRRGSHPPQSVVLLQSHDGADASGVVDAVDASAPRARKAQERCDDWDTQWNNADDDPALSSSDQNRDGFESFDAHSEHGQPRRENRLDETPETTDVSQDETRKEVA